MKRIDSADASALQKRAAANVETVASERVLHPIATPPKGESERAMYQRVGQLTRLLHDALRELGYDRNLVAAAQSLPDARDRLSYIATLTSQAADRVLSAVEAGQANVSVLEADTRALAQLWDRYAAGAHPDSAFKALADDTRSFLDRMPGRTAAARAQLHDIMMAQDFHDLTGQVIKRVAEVAHSLEANLLALLVETRLADEVTSEPSLSGPAVRAGADTIASQSEADELLASLGF